MLVTILYRLKDEPAVTAANPFTDVSSGGYSDQAGISAFARTAMAWANAEGLPAPPAACTPPRERPPARRRR